MFEMEKFNICVIIIVYGAIVLTVKAEDGPSCLQFTWITPQIDNKPDRYNCSTFKSVPCIEPIILSENPPNISAIWEARNYTLMCNVTSGNVCIKYTFSYNNQIVNSSLFCGKAIEDKIEPVTSGCYEQSLDGYVVEMCACQPRRGREPCNTSSNLSYSLILFMIIVLFTLTNFPQYM